MTQEMAQLTGVMVIRRPTTSCARLRCLLRTMTPSCQDHSLLAAPSVQVYCFALAAMQQHAMCLSFAGGQLTRVQGAS